MSTTPIILRVTRTHHSVSPPRLGTWLRWIVANMVGELVGFGLAGAIGAVAASLIEGMGGASLLIVTGLVIIAVGLVEGGAVAYAQWLVLQRVLPALPLWRWAAATVIGAVAAWAAGMSIGMSAGDALQTPPPPAAQLATGAAIGALAGLLLAFPQWLALRRHASGAVWWIPAHVAAWMAGMLIAFSGMAAIPDGSPVWEVAAGSMMVGLAMGGAVAAITGLAVLTLRRSSPSTVPHAEGLPII